MDTRLLDTLRLATSLELYELSVAISRMLSDPHRILEIRQHLYPGAQVMYYDERSGTLAPGRIEQLQANSAVVRDDITHTYWKLSYAAIIADPSQRAAQPPQAPPQRPDLTAFKPGDSVGFTDRHLRERIGTVTRINAKTCTILCEGEQWRVSPGLLRKVIDL